MQGLLSAAKAPSLQASLAKAALSTSARAGTTVLRPSAPAFVNPKSGTAASQSARGVVASAVAEAPAPSVAHPTDNGSAPHTPRRVNDAAIVLKFLLPSSVVGPILGKEGSHMRALKEETGVYVQFSRPGTGVFSPRTRILIMSGDTPEACKAAVKLMLENIAKDGALERLRHRPTGFNSDKIYLRQIIPSTCAGKVLGPGGEQIANIATTTGCAVVVEAKPDNAAFVPFRLVNYMAKTTDQMAAAVGQVIDLVLLEERYPAQIKDINSVCFRVVELPERKAGSLLGPGGAHIKTLQEVLRCKMGICESSTKPGSRFCSIWGSPDNVRVAVDVVLVATGQEPKSVAAERGVAVDVSDTASVASGSTSVRTTYAEAWAN